MECPFSCFDAKAGIQYDAGLCLMLCNCDCSFVCSTLTYHKKIMHSQLIAQQKDRVDNVALIGAHVLLDNAVCVHDTTGEEVVVYYSTTVASGTPQECVLASSPNEDSTTLANHNLNMKLTNQQFVEIDNGMRHLQHKNGPT